MKIRREYLLFFHVPRASLMRCIPSSLSRRRVECRYAKLCGLSQSACAACWEFALLLEIKEGGPLTHACCPSCIYIYIYRYIPFSSLGVAEDGSAGAMVFRRSKLAGECLERAVVFIFTRLAVCVCLGFGLGLGLVVELVDLVDLLAGGGSNKTGATLLLV